MNVFALICCFILLNGCVNYQVPVDTNDLPTSTNATVSQIELSPVLEIKIENEHAHY